MTCTEQIVGRAYRLPGAATQLAGGAPALQSGIPMLKLPAIHRGEFQAGGGSRSLNVMLKQNAAKPR